MQNACWGHAPNPMNRKRSLWQNTSARRNKDPSMKMPPPAPFPVFEEVGFHAKTKFSVWKGSRYQP